MIKIHALNVPVTAFLIPGAVENCFLKTIATGLVDTSPVMGRQTSGSRSAIELSMLITVQAGEVVTL